MKISLSWLREMIPLPPLTDLVARLNLAGLEVASLRPIGTEIPKELAPLVGEPGPVWASDKVVFAKILRIDRHPDADRLKLPIVDHGTGEEKPLVTGAPNIAVGESGQTVILARTGSVLFDGHSDVKTLKELKPTKIRGIPSDSMLCSAFELGLSDEHEGIILYPEEIKPGTPAVDVLGDTVVEVDILPNMGRCLSMLGVAREVAALFGGEVCTPEAKLSESGDWPAKVGVSIEDTSVSQRYSSRAIAGVKVGPSPAWLQRRLSASGMRPINNLVDVTNLVMLEQGQPLHAFDLDKLAARNNHGAINIRVRDAKVGEVLKTLDGQDRKLEPGMLVIADDQGPIALAGVMGGADTEVGPETTNVLLESAHFDPIRIRKAAQALHLPSEASLRFSRGVAATQAGPALERAADLIARLGGGRVATGIIESWPVRHEPRKVILCGKKIRSVLGVSVPVERVETILHALRFGVKRVGVDPEGSYELEVTLPPERLDIQEGDVDLIEEISRLEGYDRLPSTLLEGTIANRLGNPENDFHNRVRDLVAGLGLQEVITYSLSSPGIDRVIEPELDAAGANHIALANPISPERSVMRRSVAASVLEIATANLRQNGAPVQKLFELGRAYLPPGENGRPSEPHRLAIVLSGRREAPFWDGKAPEALDLFDLKGTIEEFVELLGLDASQLRLDGKSARPALHPGRQANIAYRFQGKERPLGFFGELHPRSAQTLGLSGPVLVAEIDLASLMGVLPTRRVIKGVSRFPMALRDVAVVVDEAVAADAIAREIRAAAGDLLGELRLFDIYRGQGVPEGRKSLAWSLGYQAMDKTLADKDIDKAHQKVEERLVRQMGAAIRGR